MTMPIPGLPDDAVRPPDAKAAAAPAIHPVPPPSTVPHNQSAERSDRERQAAGPMDTTKGAESCG
jgi:hypothetical protein